MRKLARWSGLVVLVLVGIAAGGFGLLQTRPGKDFLAAKIARMISRPDTDWSIDGLAGIVPFHLKARRITLSDPGGVWLAMRDVRLDIDPAGLLAGRLQVSLLRAAEIDKARPAEGPSTPLPELLRVPRLPLALVVDRLDIARLVLEPPNLGVRVAATVTGDVTVRAAALHADLDIHRTDGSPGEVTLHTAVAGANPRLGLRLQASEPTGMLLDHMLGRTDRLPLTLSIKGDGLLADWTGHLAATAGPQSRLDADVALAVAKETVVALSARAAVAPLLPSNLAPLVGSQARLSAHATFGNRIAIDRLRFATASGTVAGSVSFSGGGDAVAGHLRADLPDLSKLDAIAGGSLRGSAALTAELSGSERRPIVSADLSGSDVASFGAAVARIDARAKATLTGPVGDADTRIALDGGGRLAGIVLPKGGELAARLGQEVDWSLAAVADREARSLDLARFELRSSGLELGAAGHLGVAADGVAGTVNLTGLARGLPTGIAAADALLGKTTALAATLRRDDAGAVFLDNFALTGAGAKLAGTARFDPRSDDLAAALSLDIPRLEPLRAALGVDVAGVVSARLKADGPLDRLHLQADIDGRKLAAAGSSIDRLQLSGVVGDLAQPKAVIGGSFRAGGLSGQLALTAAPIGDAGLMVSDLRLTAVDSSLAGNLRLGLANRLIEGSLTGHFPDLSRWSVLAGTTLGGSLDVKAALAAANGGQGLDLTIDGARLAVGSRSSRSTIARLAATARLADLMRSPSGTGRLALSDAHFGGFDFATASLSFASPHPGRFAFQGSAGGHPLGFTLAGEGGLRPGGADLSLARLSGSIAGENFALDQPLELSRRGADLALSNLALRLGSGRLSGRGSLKGSALGFTINAADLPLAAAGRLVGQPNLHGELNFAATLGGSLSAPQGHLTLQAADLSAAISHGARTPRLGLAASADWNGRAVDLKGQVTGLQGDRLVFSGSLPLLLTRQPLGLRLPPQGRLALSLQGGGDIGHLAGLLPLGEDRVSGEFAADVSVGGTLAAPAASGRLQLTKARYENFASGAVLNDLTADLVGSGDSIRLASLSATDGAGGSLKAQGGVVLGGAVGASAQLSATLDKFRIAARDEALATASGTIAVAGPFTGLKITAPLTVEHAELNLPTSLPPNVVVLRVTSLNGKNGAAAPPPAAAPALPAALDISLRLPGPVIVQGHGLDSQWSGRLKITGTSAAPKIAGTLTANRGSYALLGKTFRLTRGTIAFDGSAKIDPALDIVAEANAADITAEVTIGGFASSPTVSLSSNPPLPRDEILARVLFGSGVRQITPGQGLELAQAAAALAGGGPGVLDRLRGGLGLDWLRLGQGPAGAASSILNPSVVTPTTTSTTALSAGKYIAPGVSVGVTQGVSPPTSKVTVEVDLGHHVTVDTEAGQNGGTGIGLNYNYDY